MPAIQDQTFWVRETNSERLQKKTITVFNYPSKTKIFLLSLASIKSASDEKESFQFQAEMLIHLFGMPNGWHKMII